MDKTLAQTLLDSRNVLDRLWRYKDLPSFVSVTATIIDHAIVKCLQAGGWDVYFDPEDETCKLQRIEGR